MKRDIILLTGATGRIGPHVLEALLDAGYCVRVATPDAPIRLSEVDWRQVDFTAHTDYKSLVHGVRHIVHLAAELNEPVKMRQVNVDASSSLAAAAEDAGVDVFLYSSSVGVYGHPAKLVIDEKTPVMSLNPGVDNVFLDKPYLYDYCISKLEGEHVINARLKNTRNVMMRFSNVVTEIEIAKVLTWGWRKRLWRGGRISHQVYVKDVAAAVVHLLRSHEGGAICVSPEIYIVSSDHERENCYRHLFYRKARKIGLPSWSGCPLWVPSWVDRMKDRFKFRRFFIGYPAGSVVYSPLKLLGTGFRHPYSIINIQNKVIESLFSKTN